MVLPCTYVIKQQHDDVASFPLPMFCNVEAHLHASIFNSVLIVIYTAFYLVLWLIQPFFYRRTFYQASECRHFEKRSHLRQLFPCNVLLFIAWLPTAHYAALQSLPRGERHRAVRQGTSLLDIDESAIGYFPRPLSQYK